MSQSIRKERAQHSRQLGEMSLTPLTGDGEHTRAALEEIRCWLGARPEMVEPAQWEAEIKDKIPRWRLKLRTARYLDWKARKA